MNVDRLILFSQRDAVRMAHGRALEVVRRLAPTQNAPSTRDRGAFALAFRHRGHSSRRHTRGQPESLCVGESAGTGHPLVKQSVIFGNDFAPGPLCRHRSCFDPE